MTENERAILLGASTIVRQLARAHNDTYQKVRDSQSAIAQHKGRMAMDRSVHLLRIAGEIDMVASTDGFANG